MPVRTSIACERCRRLRKRCRPPHPCPSCRAAGLACHVRSKARPQRSQIQSTIVTEKTRAPQPLHLQHEAAASSRSNRDAAASPGCAPRRNHDRVNIPLPSAHINGTANCSSPDQGKSYKVFRYRELLNGIKRLVSDHAEAVFGLSQERHPCC